MARSAGAPVVRFAVYIRDITRRYRYKSMYRLSKKLLQQAFDRLATAVVIVDARPPGPTVAYVNSALEQLTGWDISEILGRRLADLVIGGDMPAAEDALPGEERSLLQRWNCRDGAVLELTFQLAPLYERPGAPAYWLLSQTVADAEQSGAGRARRARANDSRDAATGLPCRRIFEDVLRRDWGIARREQRAVTLIMFQVDAIDAYRELFGRHSTDACMLKVGHAIS
ncbi:MAG TPA: diguanylate cyclase, partial [Chromatiales bacterium]|nr:diguanylate cyclase [Chromatiales bacterium]